MSKLTRATVPMCPECGGKLQWFTGCDGIGAHRPGQPNYRCVTCKHECHIDLTSPVHWGLYVPDVAGVVVGMGAALKSHANLAVIRKGYNVPLVTVGELRKWMDELEGKK